MELRLAGQGLWKERDYATISSRNELWFPTRCSAGHWIQTEKKKKKSSSSSNREGRCIGNCTLLEFVDLWSEICKEYISHCHCIKYRFLSVTLWKMINCKYIRIDRGEKATSTTTFNFLLDLNLIAVSVPSLCFGLIPRDFHWQSVWERDGKSNWKTDLVTKWTLCGGRMKAV